MQQAKEWQEKQEKSIKGKLSLLSPRAEKQLCGMDVKAQSYEVVTTTSSNKTKLLKVEQSAIVSFMSRAEYLTLMFYMNIIKINPKDLKELQHFLMTQVIMQSKWYKKNSYYADLKMRKKLDALTSGSICQITCDLITAKQIYHSMGITQQAYNKKWKERHEEISQQLQTWLLNAAEVVNENCKFG